MQTRLFSVLTLALVVLSAASPAASANPVLAFNCEPDAPCPTDCDDDPGTEEPPCPTDCEGGAPCPDFLRDTINCTTGRGCDGGQDPPSLISLRRILP